MAILLRDDIVTERETADALLRAVQRHPGEKDEWFACGEDEERTFCLFSGAHRLPTLTH